jgi:hypothetical protein
MDRKAGLLKNRNKGKIVMRTAIGSKLVLITLLPMLASSIASADYYKTPPLFVPAPIGNADEKQAAGAENILENIGPIGLGINFVKPGMTMKILSVQKGSPAEATGKLKPGQLISSVNGIVFQDSDPRILLANIITEAEATDGIIKLKVEGAGDVVVNIPVLGRYSTTWPLNCPKSGKIVRNFADFIAKKETPGWGDALFMLSTGEAKDLEAVKRWMKNAKAIGNTQWARGYAGIGFCEYYLRTGDKSVLPAIEKTAAELRNNMANGAWGGRGYPAGFTYSTGSGHLHAAGVHCLTFLLLAKQCGVKVDDYALNASLTHFFRFAGRGNVGYGNNVPEGGFRDNGKTGGFAMGMAAAALLTPDGEKSIYARARDNSAMKSFYATSWFMAGHTGGGIGEIWHNMAMGLVMDKKPAQYRSFINERRWSHELSRRFDGSIGITGVNSRYDEAAGQHSWGAYYAMVYTIPRKQLRLFGAPKTEWCQDYQLPDRPWGNKADDTFQSNDPVEYESGKVYDLSKELIPTHNSLPVFNRLGAKDASEELLLQYLHHPEYGLRDHAVSRMRESGRLNLIVPLMKSKDARAREAGVIAIAGPFKNTPLPAAQITPEMFDLLEKMINDPNEAWSVLYLALEAFSEAPAERIERNYTRLLELLKHEEWWISLRALRLIIPVFASEAHYKEAIPLVAEAYGKFRVNAGVQTARLISPEFAKASPEIKQYAYPYFEKIFTNLAKDITDANTGAPLPGAALVTRSKLVEVLAQLPGGMVLAKHSPKITRKYAISREEKDLYIPDGKFIKNEQLMGNWYYLNPNYGAEITLTRKGLDYLDRMFREKRQNAMKFTGKNKDKKMPKRDRLILLDNGRIQRDGKTMNGHEFWSDNILYNIFTSEALEMQIVKFGGKDYLAIEKGGYPEPEEEGKGLPPETHRGYDLYTREQEPPQLKETTPEKQTAPKKKPAQDKKPVPEKKAK